VREFRIAVRGYDRRQVDELLARIEGTTGRAPAVAVAVTAADVRAARFTKKMRGYARRRWTRRCGTRRQSWGGRLPDSRTRRQHAWGLRGLPDQDRPRLRLASRQALRFTMRNIRLLDGRRDRKKAVVDRARNEDLAIK
jgi:DivIVA domain-containing protein